MISRAAEQCFWLYRHIERIDNIARFMNVNQNFILDANLDSYDTWFPFVIVVGEEQRFVELFGKSEKTNNQLIQDYLVWNKENPVSIYSSSKAARENARIVRDTINIDMWESINSFWLWLQHAKSRKLFNKDKHAFYHILKKNIEVFHGQFYSTMLQEEAFYFMQLGLMLERINQTARILDVKFHRMALKSDNNKRESAVETLHWLSLLKFFTASDSFLKCSGFTTSRENVASFLIFEERFPKSILFCLNKAVYCLQQLQYENKSNSTRSVKLQLNKLYNEISTNNIKSIFNNGLHHFLTELINKTCMICDTVQKEFFDPNISFLRQLEGMSI